jgi:steroid delta-isomerase-like uncharacterized protein
MSEKLGEFLRHTNDEIFNKGNLEIIDEVFSDDFVINDVKKMRMSRDNLKQYLSSIKQAFPDLEVSVEPLVIKDDKIAWVRTNIGTHQKEFFGVPPTGRKIVWKSCVISRVVDGKIVEEWHTTNPQDQLK